MFGKIFSDIKGFVGSDFWDTALEVAGPTVKEILSGGKSSNGGSAPLAPGMQGEYDVEIGSTDKSLRSDSAKTYAPESADFEAIREDQAKLREKWIVRMRQYAQGDM